MQNLSHTNSTLTLTSTLSHERLKTSCSTSNKIKNVYLTKSVLEKEGKSTSVGNVVRDLKTRLFEELDLSLTPIQSYENLKTSHSTSNKTKNVYSTSTGNSTNKTKSSSLFSKSQMIALIKSSPDDLMAPLLTFLFKKISFQNESLEEVLSLVNYFMENYKESPDSEDSLIDCFDSFFRHPSINDASKEDLQNLYLKAPQNCKIIILSHLLRHKSYKKTHATSLVKCFKKIYEKDKTDPFTEKQNKLFLNALFSHPNIIFIPKEDLYEMLTIPTSNRMTDLILIMASCKRTEFYFSPNYVTKHLKNLEKLFFQHLSDDNILEKIKEFRELSNNSCEGYTPSEEESTEIFANLSLEKN